MKKIVLCTVIMLISMASFASDDNCYQISDSSDREACLGNAYSTDDTDARNIILGNCYSLSDWANKKGLREVCVNGRDGCYSVSGGDAVSACVSCDGSNKWARLYAVGYNMSCY